MFTITYNKQAPLRWDPNMNTAPPMSAKGIGTPSTVFHVFDKYDAVNDERIIEIENAI
jgi:hypothetical protein